MVKKTVKKLVLLLSDAFAKTKIGRVVAETILSSAMDRQTIVRHKGVAINFVSPNPLLVWRATSFATKEPDTLRWIEAFDEGETLWDIGANVGLYALYAAKARNANVFAFEPSIFNLEILGRNIAVNDLAAKISIVPVALSDNSGFAKMLHTTAEWGGALSSFGADYGADGEALLVKIGYRTLGMRADDLVATGLLPFPDHIKIDVDGIEHLILAGATNVLKNAKSVLVEINDDFVSQSESSSNYLTNAGFVMVEKERSIYTASPGSKTPNVYNQIWVKAEKVSA